jgi:hypothetical protein
VQEMVYLGEIEPGKPALFALLELIRKNVGLNVRSDIDELLLIDTDETQEQMEKLVAIVSKNYWFYSDLICG